MKPASSEKRFVELEALYRTQAVRLRRILHAKFVGTPRAVESAPETRVALAGHEVDDLIHDVFARVLALGDRLEFGRLHEPIAYLVTVARNLVVDSIRRDQSRALDVAYPQRTQLDDADLYERHVEAVIAYVAGLPPELSAAFDARFVRGMSQRDAAVALGVTRRRVRTLEERLVTGAARELSGSAPHDAGCPLRAANGGSRRRRFRPHTPDS